LYFNLGITRITILKGLPTFSVNRPIIASEFNSTKSINLSADASGNAIDYVYSEDHVNGEYTLSRINYSNNSVRFNYEDREDKAIAYQAGAKYSQTKRPSCPLMAIRRCPSRQYLSLSS
jgi:hypothetical protein